MNIKINITSVIIFLAILPSPTSHGPIKKKKKYFPRVRKAHYKYSSDTTIKKKAFYGCVYRFVGLLTKPKEGFYGLSCCFASRITQKRRVGRCCSLRMKKQIFSPPFVKGLLHSNTAHLLMWIWKWAVHAFPQKPSSSPAFKPTVFWRSSLLKYDNSHVI